MIGNIIGNYKIEKKLGEGGMGAVYKGIDMMLEREVAIKALRPELGSQPQVVERFRSEAVTLAKLNHPHIAILYSFFRQADDFFMVMEYVRGETLDNVISRRGTLPCEQAITLFCQALDGIDHAHRFGVIHRDIKPANMMLTDTGTLKVLDFGIARLLGTARMTKAGNLIGTIEYMPPEQVRGKETDARSDIYSLGILLYEMLTGRVPFASENEYELMRSQIEDQQPPPRQLNPAIPEIVEQAIMRAMAKNPDDRFQTAGEFRALLLSAGVMPTGAPITAASNAPTYIDPNTNDPQVNTSPVSRPPVSQPSVSKDTFKETRLASSTGDMAATIVDSPGNQLREKQASVSAGGANQMKETRLGAPGEVAIPPYPQPAAAMPQPPASFFSKLTWVHYTAAGVAAMIVLLGLVTVPLILLAGNNKKAADTPTVTDRPASQPAGAAQTRIAPEQPSSLTDSGQPLTGVSSPVTEPNNPSVMSPTPPVLSGPVSPPSSARASRSAPAERPAPTPRPAAPKPRNDAAAAAAADKARRRAEALKALDQ